MEIPRLVVSDGAGNVFEIPELEMLGYNALNPSVPDVEELIPLPEGSDLFELPDRISLGFDRKHGVEIPLTSYGDIEVIPVAAFLAPAYTQLYRAAYKSEKCAKSLPLYAYTPVGYADGKFWVPAIRVDEDIRQDLEYFNENQIEHHARKMLKRYPQNHLVNHIVNNCVRRYSCPAARNFVLGRWEAPIPTAKACNAACVGCISLQQNTGIPCAQERISFVPTAEEIIEFTVPHLQNAERAIVSFGQGCEGEPLMNETLLEDSILGMREKTNKGTINLNTNGSLPEVVEKLCEAGLDSIRISLNSAQKEYYDKYFRPKNYQFEDVLKSFSVCRKHNIWISINYFIFPGITDQMEEFESLCDIIDEYKVDYIQMRNLNIDPNVYIQTLGIQAIFDDPMGILSWKDELMKKFPDLRFGYFNPPKEEF
jgi:wyosine [tRNA(Phe)-imidazoG37] synthetase (radical SAM superfamily)